MESPHSHSILIIMILSLLSASLFVSSANLPHHDFLRCLTDRFKLSNSSTTDVIFTPSNASFASLLQSQNLRPTATFPLRPSLIITPFIESEIQAAIFCSKSVGMQIRARSGGHDYEGLSYVSQNPFVIVDMRNFRSVSVDTDEKTAWVQVGATLGQLYYTLANKTKTLAFPAGVCPTVGVGGHFSGGGYGMMSRRHSIAADHIIDAVLINADGKILDRESMGKELFWAMTGGGGTSFGIAVAYKISLVVIPETITVFNVIRTLEQNATQLVYKWQHIADRVDENLLLRLFLSSVESPTPTTGNRTISAAFTSLYLGRVSDLLPIMQKEFPELGLVKQDCTEMSWIESVRFFAGLGNQSLDVLFNRTPSIEYTKWFFKGKSDYVTQPIPIDGLNEIWSFLHQEPENLAVLQFSPYGGVLSNYSESETPFPHRGGNKFMVHYGVSWQRKEEVHVHVDWIRRLYNHTAPFVSQNPRAAYFNYRDLDLGTNNQGNTSYAQASVWGRKYFKSNFDRLVQVKTQVDSSNLFRNEQSIPVA